MIQAKKSLGQNFLISNSVVKEIANSAEIDSDEIIIEIGPGKGVLTSILLEKSEKIIAIEKDNRLIEKLEEKFKKEIGENKLQIIHGDALEQNLSKLTHGQSYKIVANIPYYISGAILRKLFSEEKLPESVVMLMQREVVDRIVAQDKKESILSISVKAYGDVQKVGNVKRNLFRPIPKVDSAILKVNNISNSFFANLKAESFFEIVKQGFSSKRKKLVNNLKNIDDIHSLLNSCSIDADVRAEDLALEEWRCIAQKL